MSFSKFPSKTSKFTSNILKTSCLCFGALSFTSVFALDEEVLWLPKKYASLYLDLKDAAKIAENLDRCEKVIRGTIDMSRSSHDHPIFRILCRQPNGKSYNEMVDGKLKVNLTTVVNLDEDWKLCNQMMRDKIGLMKDVEILTTKMPEPSIRTDDIIGFEIDFNGKNMQGTLLKYKAICHLSDDKNKIKIIPRTIRNNKK